MDYKQFELLMENVSLDDKVKEDILLSGKPFFEFQDFLKVKTGMNEEAQEKFFKIYAESRLIEMGDDLPEEEEYMELIMREISDKYEYHDTEGLVNALKILMSFSK